MPQVPFLKIAKKKDDLPMITPGISDAGIMPGEYGSMSAGLTLDYRAIQGGGIDSSVPISYADDKILNIYRVVWRNRFGDVGDTIVDAISKEDAAQKIVDELMVLYVELIENKDENVEDIVEVNDVSDYQYHDSVDSKVLMNSDDNVKGNGGFVGDKEDGWELRHSLNVNSADDYLPYICAKCEDDINSRTMLVEHLTKKHKLKSTLINLYVQHAVQAHDKKIDEIEKKKEEKDFLRIVYNEDEDFKKNFINDNPNPYIGRFVDDAEKIANTGYWIITDVYDNNNVSIAKPYEKIHCVNKPSKVMLNYTMDGKLKQRMLDVIWKELPKKAFPDYIQSFDPSIYDPVSDRQPRPLLDIFNQYFCSLTDDILEVKEDEDKQEKVKVKKSFPEYTQLQDSSLYEQVVERDDNNTTQHFDSLNARFADDTIDIEEKSHCPKCNKLMKYDDGKDAYVCSCGFVGINGPAKITRNCLNCHGKGFTLRWDKNNRIFGINHRAIAYKYKCMFCDGTGKRVVENDKVEAKDDK